MKPLTIVLVGLLLAGNAVSAAPPPPQRPYHLLRGPYEYDHTGKHPRWFDLDGKRYTTVAALQAAVAALPRRSTVYLRGSCMRYDAIELPPRPIGLSEFRAYCESHQVSFTWTFGPGGY